MAGGVTRASVRLQQRAAAAVAAPVVVQQPMAVPPPVNMAGAIPGDMANQLLQITQQQQQQLLTLRTGQATREAAVQAEAQRVANEKAHFMQQVTNVETAGGIYGYWVYLYTQSPICINQPWRDPHHLNYLITDNMNFLSGGSRSQLWVNVHPMIHSLQSP